jgi:hypothetical protein
MTDFSIRAVLDLSFQNYDELHPEGREYTQQERELIITMAIEQPSIVTITPLSSGLRSYESGDFGGRKRAYLEYHVTNALSIPKLRIYRRWKTFLFDLSVNKDLDVFHEYCRLQEYGSKKDPAVFAGSYLYAYLPRNKATKKPSGFSTEP